MELAKLFATVGFKVDKDGLTEFRKEMASLKTDLKEAAVQTGKLKNQLTGLTAQFKQFQKMTDTRGVTKWMDGIEKSVTHLNNMQMAVSQQSQRSEQWADRFASSIFKLHQAIQGRKNEVAEYAQAIMLLSASFERLKAATAGISRFRQVPSSAISQTGAGYGGSREGAGRPRGGGGEDSNQYIGYWGRASGIAKTWPAAMLRPMLPTGMGLFNAVAVGYALKEMIATGREMMAMENMLKAISGDTETFNKNLKFVKQTADELGISVLDVGQSFAKMFMSGKEQFDTDVLQKSFKGAQTYFRLLGMSAEKIRLANKAIEQMFNKQRVTAEELRGQLGEHAAGVIQYFAEAAGTNTAGLFKLMENGQVSADVVIKALEAMGAFASASPELQKQLKMSAAAQERFNNKMREFSQVMMESGLDELLTEMFGALTKLVGVFTPLFKGLLLIAKGWKELFKVMAENSRAIKLFLLGFFGAGGILAALTLLRVQGLAGATSSLMWFTRGVWAAIPAVARLTGLLGGLIYVAQSVADYLNGEDNWVHAWQLDIEYAMILWDTFIMEVLTGWELLKRDVSNITIKDAFNFAKKGAEHLPVVGQIVKGVEWVGNNVTFDPDPNNPYKKQPTIQQPRYSPNMMTNSPLIINIDASKVEGAQNDPEKFGRAVGNALVPDIQKLLGGVGVYN